MRKITRGRWRGKFDQRYWRAVELLTKTTQASKVALGIIGTLVILGHWKTALLFWLVMLGLSVFDMIIVALIARIVKETEL